MESTAPEGDALLVKLDTHSQARSVSFALPNLSNISGQLDSFPSRSVSRKATAKQEAGLIVERSVRETVQQQSSV